MSKAEAENQDPEKGHRTEAEGTKPEKKNVNATPVDFIFDGLMWTYDSFMHFVSINDTDHTAMVFFKIFLRAVGIIIALILSPFIIFGIIVSILVVS